MTTDCDVLIAGAGPAGAALAVALAPLALRVCLADPAADLDADAPDRRALALALGSQRILAGLGAWPALAPLAAPITAITVTQRGWPGITRLDARTVRQPALGYVVGDRALQRALLARLAGSAVRRLPAAVGAITPHGERLEVSLATADGSPQRLTTRLLVAADGSGSAVCRLAGLTTQQRELADSVLLANVHTDRPHHGVAHERFADGRALALLPAPGPCDYTLVWTLAHARAADLAALAPSIVAPMLQDVLGWRTGRVRRLDQLRCVPLREQWLRHATGNRLLAIGNAANTLHPIAAQGFNCGLRDVATLAELLAEASRADEDPGAEARLAVYRRRREADWRHLRLATGWLPRLFENPAPPPAAARSLALTALDLCRPLKRHLMHRAMGLHGPQGRLQRGCWP
ncbi:MAG: 2-octaprenyl-6-methoxyphenyl hydroxylase [Immundisolibacter sp.]